MFKLAASVLAAAGIGVALLSHPFTFVGPVLTPEPLPENAQIIDMHCHLACLDEDRNGCFVSERMRSNVRFPIYLKAMGFSETELIEKGDEIVARRLNDHINTSRYVDQAVILAMDGVITDGELDKSRTEVYVPNSFIAEMSRKYKNLLYGASINPYRSDAISRLRQAASDGAVLIKWLPATMHIDAEDPALIPFYKELVRLDIPLLVHVGKEMAFSHADNALGDPRKLAAPLKAGVTVIAAHVATTGTYDGVDAHELLLPMFAQNPNLYADISSLTLINKLGYLNDILAHGEVLDRLVYGTDWPLQFFPMVSPWYFQKNLTIRQMRHIGGIDNVWDQDVALKQALGVPAGIFTRANQLLRFQTSSL